MQLLEWAEQWMRSREVQNAICLVTLLSCLAYVVETYLKGDCVRNHGIWMTLMAGCKVQPFEQAFLYWFDIISLLVFTVDFGESGSFGRFEG